MGEVVVEAFGEGLEVDDGFLGEVFEDFLEAKTLTQLHPHFNHSILY